MLNKGENVPVAISEHFRGGEGEVWLKDLTCGRKPPNVKVFSEMTLHKGCSVGYHTHTGDSEIIYILSGEGISREGEEEHFVRAGDTLVCLSGQSHSLRNEREEPLRYIAAIIAE